MIEAIRFYGPYLKPSSYHELRIPLLKELAYTKDLLNDKKMHGKSIVVLSCHMGGLIEKSSFDQFLGKLSIRLYFSGVH